MFCEDPSKLCFGCTYVFKSRGGRLLPRRPAPQRGARAGARSRAGPVRSAPGRSEPRCLGACSSGPSSPRTRRVLLCPPSVITVPAFAARCGKRPATAHADLSAGDAKADPSPRRPGREVLGAGELRGPASVPPSARRGGSCRAQPSPAPSPRAGDRPLRRSPAVAMKELRHGGHTALCAKVPAAICQASPGLTFNPSPFPVHPCLLRNEGYGETILIDNIKTDFSKQDDHFLSENISQVHSGAGRRCSDELAHCRSTCRADSHDCIGVATSYKGPRGRSEANPQSRSPEGARTHTV